GEGLPRIGNGRPITPVYFHLQRRRVRGRGRWVVRQVPIHFELRQLAADGAQVGVEVAADDLAAVVDANRAAAGGARDVKRRVRSGAEEEAVQVRVGVKVRADDLAAVVDPVGAGVNGVGIVEARELAAAQEMAVEVKVRVGVRTNDLARRIDTAGRAAVRTKGVVNSLEDVAWNGPVFECLQSGTVTRPRLGGPGKKLIARGRSRVSK